MTAPRPRFSPDIARAAAEEIVTDLINGGHVQDSDREQSIDDIVENARLHDDGYDIAQALDAHAHWDCNAAMVEILDGFGWACSGAIAEAQKRWAAETAPQPPFPIGARVRINARETGEITGIYEHGAAQYLVKVDGDKEANSPSQSRRIVNFEDAKPETVAA